MLFSLSSAFSQTDDIAKPFNTIEEYDEFTNTSSIGITGEVLDEEGNALILALGIEKLNRELKGGFIFAVSGIDESDALGMVYFLTNDGERFSFIGQAAENTLIFSVNSLESLYNVFSKKGTRFRFGEQVYTITDETVEYVHKQITSQINPEEVERFDYRFDSYKSETSWNELNPNKPRVDFRIVEISYPDSVFRKLEDMERLPYELFETYNVSFELLVNEKGYIVEVNGSASTDDWQNWKFSESDIQEVTRLTLQLEVDRKVEISQSYEYDFESLFELKWEGELGRDPRVIPLPVNRTNTDATITLRFEVNPDGSIGRILPILRMNPELEGEVIRTLRNWRFNPLPSRAPQEAEWGTITFRFVGEGSKSIELPPPPPPEEEEDTFTVVENMPELIGGLDGLKSSIKYPLAFDCEGRVFLQFIVNERGEVENPRVLRGINKACDDAAIDAIRSAKFKPGIQRGRPVRVQHSLAIDF